MDFMSVLIVVVGLGTAAFIVAVLAWAAGAGLRRTWFRLTHRHDARLVD